MIGLLLVTHGTTGEALLASAAHMLGTRPARAAALGVSPDDDPDAVLARARALIEPLDDGSGVLLLTDMFGSTPCNIAARLLADGRVEGVSGLSLPMLVRTLATRGGTLQAAVARAISGGTEGVLHINLDRCRDAQR